MPDSSEWTLIEQLVDILKPFQHVIVAMSGVKYCGPLLIGTPFMRIPGLSEQSALIIS